MFAANISFSSHKKSLRYDSGRYIRSVEGKSVVIKRFDQTLDLNKSATVIVTLRLHIDTNKIDRLECVHFL